jgi:hypothetical protein
VKGFLSRIENNPEDYGAAQTPVIPQASRPLELYIAVTILVVVILIQSFLYINQSIQYHVFRSNYEKIQQKINQRCMQKTIIEFITPNDSQTNSLVMQITGKMVSAQGWEKYWRDIKTLYNWVINNIQYREDSLYPMLPTDPSGKIIFINEMWQFPNETISLRAGDCEDMAILLCSMILCYNLNSYTTECIMISGSGGGHMGVQIPVADNKLIILDPAGRYYTSNSEENITPKDIAIEISAWLNYWKEKAGEDVHVTRVFSNTLDKEFTSTSEYILWMTNR